MNKPKIAIYLAIISLGLFGGVGFASAASSEPAASQPGVIWGEDFEGSNFNYSYYYGSSSILAAIKDGQGVTGGRALMATIEAGNRSGSPDFEYRFPDKPVQGEIHARAYRRWSDGYIWNSNINKGIRIWGKDRDIRKWVCQLHTEPISKADLTKGKPVVQVESGLNDYDTTKGEVRFYQNMNLDKLVVLVPGQWYSMELMAIPDLQGQPFSGSFKVWVDGILIMDYHGVSIRKAAEANMWPANRVSFDNYYGGAGQVPPQTQYTFWDQLILSTSYIGPMIATDTTPPSAPTGLAVN